MWLLPFQGEKKNKNLTHVCNPEPQAATGSQLLFCVAMESLRLYERLIIVAGVCVCACVCCRDATLMGLSIPTGTVRWVMVCPFSNHLQLLLVNQQLYLSPRSPQPGKQTENTLVYSPPRLARLLKRSKGQR